MSILKIKDENGNWLEVPSIGGSDKVFVGENEPTNENVELWIDVDKKEVEEAAGTITQKRPLNYNAERETGNIEWQYGSYHVSDSDTFETKTSEGVWRTADDCYLEVEEKAVYKIEGLLSEDTVYSKGYLGGFKEADGSKSKGFMKTSNYIKADTETNYYTNYGDTYVFVKIPDEAKYLYLNAELSSENNPKTAVKIYKIDSEELTNMSLTQFQNSVTFEQLEALPLVEEEYEVEIEATKTTIETATMKYKNSKNEFQAIPTVPNGGIKGQVLTKKNDEDGFNWESIAGGVLGKFGRHYKYSFTNANGTTEESRDLPYWVYEPKNVDKDEKLPLILLLHSSQVKLDTNLSSVENLDNLVNDLITRDFPKDLYDGKYGDIRAYIVMPMTTGATRGWAKRAKELNDLITYFKKKLLNRIDENAIYLLGYSLGATGAFEVATAYPDTFKKILAVAGGLDGVTNNTRPYDQSTQARLDIETKYASLRAYKKTDPTVLETETMKYEWGEDNYKADSTDPNVSKFRNERLNDVISKLDGKVKVWAIVCKGDDEVNYSISDALCNGYTVTNADGTKTTYKGISNSKCTIVEEGSHAGAYVGCIDKRKEIIDFLTSK